MYQVLKFQKARPHMSAMCCSWEEHEWRGDGVKYLLPTRRDAVLQVWGIIIDVRTVAPLTNRY
jgi:hypothetical protein